MANLKFVPLYAYQKQHMEHILEYVNTNHYWVKFKTCISHLFPHLPRDTTSILELVEKGGCPYYYHILSKLKETQCLAFLTNCPRAHPSLFRHVYFSIDKGEVTILGKGALWFQSKNACLESGKKYCPSIDFPESLGCQVILSVENCHLHYPDMSHACKVEALSTFCTPCDKFEKLCTSNNTIIQMPWSVNYDHHHMVPLYVYCIHNKDIWFYSWSKNIQAAYDAYLHQ